MVAAIRRSACVTLAALGGWAIYTTASAQSACVRYEAFEGLWQGTIENEKPVRHHAGAILGDPEGLEFNRDHRQLNIVFRGSFYDVDWNKVEGEKVPSLRERAQIGVDTDGYCKNIRAQTKLRPDAPGIRLHIDGSYSYGPGVRVGYFTKMCCFLYQPQAITCAAYTNYWSNSEYDNRNTPWYDGVWYVTMRRPQLPNECAPATGGPAPQQPYQNPNTPPVQTPPQSPPDGESGF